jgi:hypothetical protein
LAILEQQLAYVFTVVNSSGVVRHAPLKQALCTKDERVTYY